MGRTSITLVVLFVLAVSITTLAGDVWKLLTGPIWLHHDGRVEVRFPTVVDVVATSIGMTGEATTVVAKGVHTVGLPAAAELEYHARDTVGSGEYSASLDLSETVTFSFVVYGDTRHFEKRHESVFSAIVEENPDFVVHLGDMVDTGMLSDQWRSFFKVTSGYWANHVIYTVCGNHEFPFFNYGRLLYPPYYSFERGSFVFIVLDTNLFLNHDSPQYTWLLKQLEVAKNEGKRVFVFTHHPVFTKGPHQGDVIVKQLEELVPVFERFGVEMVFSAHDHNYQHFFKNGIHFIVTGGGGAGLYEVDESAKTDAKLLKYSVVLHYVLVEVTKEGVHVVVKTPSGKIVDEFGL